MGKDGRDGSAVWVGGLCWILATARESAVMRVSLLPLTHRPPRSATVLTSTIASTPVLIGEGEVDFTCWRCGFAICEGMTTVIDVSGKLFRCPECTALNRSRQ